MKSLAALAFALIMLGHFAYATNPPPAVTGGGQWAAIELDEPEESRLSHYLAAGDYWLGLSYGLSGAFAVWCFARLVELRRKALAASAGGLTLSGLLVAGVCFLTGCCGSPMLPLYLGLFGPRFLSVTKPLTFVLTLLSILVGFAWMLRTAEKATKENVHTRLHEAPGENPGEV